jgi:hypothetical protein
MPEIVRTAEVRPQLATSTDWSAVWAGLFTFIGIWAVFGLLGYAIFPRNGNGTDLAFGIWSIILTAIAMFVAGRVTGRLAGLAGSSDGVRHGMIMFGLAVVATIVLTYWGNAYLSGMPASSTFARANAESIVSTNLWIGFVALLLGWLGAMLGASAAKAPRVQENVKEIRPAA